METLNANTELVVHIKYSSKLQTQTARTGFYQTTYVINGETRYVGATQLEEIGARLVFPHYDEPGFKTVIELKITHDASQSAIANTMGTSVAK